MERNTLPDSVFRWCELLESADTHGLEDILSAGVVLHSPLTNAFTFNGRDNVTAVFDAAVVIVKEIRYSSVLTDGSGAWALIADAMVDDAPMQEVVLMNLDDDGLIREITLFGRPLASLTAVMRDIAPPLLARQGRGLVGKATIPGNAPLAFVTRMVERHVMPRIAPRPFTASESPANATESPSTR